MYQVLARKYRPRNFYELVGQQHVSKALTSALERGRLHHAYLFTGTRGVGKTTIARILAKCLNCETGITATPCEQCNVCQAVNEGRFIDLIEIDAASRTKVEDTRELLDNVPYAPTQGRFKVYLIDEVHMLSTHSFNALLKTLEEPPAHVKFLFATTDPQKLPITVISRCLQFTLRPLSIEEIQHHLQKLLTLEHISYDELALWQLAESAQGSLRDALSLTDQAIAYGQGQVNQHDVKDMLGLIDRHLVYDLLLAVHQNQRQRVAELLLLFRQQAIDVALVLEQLISALHELALMQHLPDLSLSYSAEIQQKIHTLARQISAPDIQLYYQICCKGRDDLNLAMTQVQGFEMCILRLLAFRPLNVNEYVTPSVEHHQTDNVVDENYQQEYDILENTHHQIDNTVDENHQQEKEVLENTHQIDNTVDENHQQENEILENTHHQFDDVVDENYQQANEVLENTHHQVDNIADENYQQEHDIVENNHHQVDNVLDENYQQANEVLENNYHQVDNIVDENYQQEDDILENTHQIDNTVDENHQQANEVLENTHHQVDSVLDENYQQEHDIVENTYHQDENIIEHQISLLEQYKSLEHIVVFDDAILLDVLPTSSPVREMIHHRTGYLYFVDGDLFDFTDETAMPTSLLATITAVEEIISKDDNQQYQINDMQISPEPSLNQHVNSNGIDVEILSVVPLDIVDDTEKRTPQEILRLPIQTLTGEWTDEKWEYWLRTSELSPAIQGILQNSLMRGQIDGESHLLIHQHYVAILTQFEDEIRQQLATLGQQQHTIFEYVEHLSVQAQTPWALEQQRINLAHQQAERWLKQNPSIAQLLEAFDGRITQIDLGE